jgi:DNA integrity scanning protein DisA with diadenylate cyclase activity
MSEPQKQVAVEEMKKEFRQIINEARNDADMDASLLNPTFFGTMFSPIDGLFILLAVGTAYRLGSGQES